jgi:hypothetical protein
MRTKLNAKLLRGLTRSNLAAALFCVLSFSPTLSFSLDTVPPENVATFAGGAAAYVGGLTFSWQAPGNDGASGTLGAGSVLYLQYSTAPAVSWSTAAAQVVQSTSGVLPSTLVRYYLGGLDPGTTYYAAVWHMDEAGNLSAISNIASGFARPFPGGAVTRAATGADTWQLKFNSYSNGNDELYGVAFDASGNIYIAGRAFNGANQDLAVQKYAPDGTLLLAKYYNGTDNCSEGGEPTVAVDKASGNFFLAGEECTSGSGAQGLIVKYDGSGNRVWVKRLPGLGATAGQGLSRVVLDGAANIYVAGTLSNAGNGRDMFVGKFDGGGNQLWSNLNNTTGNTEVARGLVVVGTSVYSAGYADHSHLGQGNNGVVRKMSAADGITDWTAVYNSTHNLNDGFTEAAVDPSGNLYVAGSEELSAATEGNVVLQKRNPEGAVIWDKNYNLSPGRYEYVEGIAMDAGGNIYLASPVYVGASSCNIEVSKIDPSGLFLGKFSYNAAGGVDQAHTLTSSGTYLFVGGHVTEGGSENFYLRKLAALEVDGVPSAVAAMTVSPGGSVGSLVLSWPAPGNNGASGTLGAGSVLYLQYSTSASVSWSTASAQVSLSTSGVTPSSMVRFSIGALDPGTTYYAAVWHKDEVGNLSAISNIASGYAKPFPGGTIIRTPAGGDGWELKFNSSSSGAEAAYGVDLDAAGNVYASGTAFSGANIDLFLHKYAPDGTLLLAKYYNGLGNCTEPGDAGVAVDKANGDFYLVGGECKSGGGYQGVILKYDNSGARLWVKRLAGLGGGADHSLSRVVTDPSGNIYVSGTLANASGGSDIYAGKFDRDGNELWYNLNNTSVNTERARGLVVVGTSVYSAGYSDQAHLGQSNNGILRKMSAAGGVTDWTSVYNSTYSLSDGFGSVVVDAGGYIYAGAQQQVAPLDRDLFLEKLTPEGGLLWKKNYNLNSVTGLNETFEGMTIGGDGYLYCGGARQVAGSDYNIQVYRFSTDGVLRGKVELTSGAGFDYSYGIVSSGTYLVLSGEVGEGGNSNAFLRKLAISDVKSDALRVSTMSAGQGANVGALLLSWAAPGTGSGTDALGAGSAFYLQYSTFPSVSWSTAAAQVSLSTSGVIPSNMVRYSIGGLDPGATYYAAVWHKDEAGSLSAISNIASGYARPFPNGNVTARTADPDGSWHVSFANTPVGAYDITYGLAADATGNIYVSGLAFNGANDDLFVQKYDAGGNLLLAKYFNGPANCSDSGYPAVAVDTVTGAFYLAGAECGTNPPTRSLVIKYDAAANIEWVRRFQGASSTQGTFLTSVALDPAGNVYVGGDTFVSLDVDSWVRKYTPAGDVVWTATKSYSAPNVDWIIGLEVKDGYVYATGSADMNVVGHGNDLTLWKLNTDGLTQWTTYYTGAANRHDYGIGVAAAGDGSLYLSGGEQLGLNDYGMLMQKRNSSGLLQWTTAYNYTTGSGNNDFLNHLVLTPDNYLYGAGYVTTGGQGMNGIVQKRDLSGALRGTYVYDAAGADDSLYAIIQYGDGLVVGGYETVGGARRHFIKKLKASAFVGPAAAPPSGLSASVFITSATLSWGLNGNLPGTPAEVARSTDNVLYPAIASTSALGYADTGLQVCTSYYYKVRNFSGDGSPTAYTSPVQVFTGNYAPLAPSGLEAASLAGRRVSLTWQPSPDPWLAYYRLYTDAGSGAVDYAVPLAVLPSTASAYTTGVLVSSPSYMFALRAVNRCGTEETNTRVLASASALNSLTGVRAAIKEPHSGKKVSGNRLTVMAEIILGEDFQVSEIRFQYKASAASAWADIVPANANHPNPDQYAPYFVHWDVSALASGNYDLRAVASDNAGNADEGAPSVTVTVDNVDFEVKETVQGDGKVKKEQVINNAVASVVQAADAEQSWVTRVSIPSDAVSFSTVTLSIVSNPLGAPAQGADLNPVGQTAEITLSNSQHQLENGQKAEIALTYPDADGDGIVDGTSYRAERLKIFSYDPGVGAWRQDLECSLDKANNKVLGRTPHFSYFAVFAPAAANLSSARAYPNPWRPGSAGAFDAAGVTFDNLMSGGSVSIFTIAGELVRELRLTAADAGVKIWNGLNTSGGKAASGVYIVRISSGGKEKILKLAVER